LRIESDLRGKLAKVIWWGSASLSRRDLKASEEQTSMILARPGRAL
jgi:hypothetical protein